MGIMTMNENNANVQDGKPKKKNSGNSGGFQGMGLSEEVYRGVVKMGFRVSTKKNGIATLFIYTNTVQKIYNYYHLCSL